MSEALELDKICGIDDDELTRRFIESVRIDNEIKTIKGLPIAGYDIVKKLPYLQYKDGRREYGKETSNTSVCRS